MAFPEDSIQNVFDFNSWWEETDSHGIVRGSLVWAFLPHVDQVPHTIIPKGRIDPKCHDKAYVQIRPLDIRQPQARHDLPVSATTLYDREMWCAYRAKKRPCLVLGEISKKVEAVDRAGMSKRKTAQTVMVAPFYGVDQSGKREGYPPAFVGHIRHIKYPQFFWDMLPSGNTVESIMRFDQLQPVGRDANSYEHSGYKLSQEALALVDEVFYLYMYSSVRKNGNLKIYIDLIEENLAS